MMMMIAPNSRARERRRGGGEGGIWRSLRGGEEGIADYGGMVPQSAACCTICKSGWVGIWHERFENVGNVLGRHSGWGYTGGVVSRNHEMHSHEDTLSYDTPRGGISCNLHIIHAHACIVTTEGSKSLTFWNNTWEI